MKFNKNVGTFTIMMTKFLKKNRLLALKIIKETCESKFSLIEKGPSVMALNSLQERVKRLNHRHQLANESSRKNY